MLARAGSDKFYWNTSSQGFSVLKGFDLRRYDAGLPLKPYALKAERPRSMRPWSSEAHRRKARSCTLLNSGQRCLDAWPTSATGLRSQNPKPWTSPMICGEAMACLQPGSITTSSAHDVRLPAQASLTSACCPKPFSSRGLQSLLCKQVGFEALGHLSCIHFWGLSCRSQMGQRTKSSAGQASCFEAWDSKSYP